MDQIIGKLDRRIIFQAVTETKDAAGGVSRSWATHLTRWANLKYTRAAGESMESGKKTSIYQAIFTIRRDAQTAALTTKHRISYDSKFWDIRSISEKADEYRKMYLVVEAEVTSPDMIG
ncbi:MAG: head-tail adaptor protein [Saprospirales bacterium]|nr:head-tail adaptor protein [Saprospirales bacterium]